MSERPGAEMFESRLAGLIGAYTEIATAGRVDPLDIARVAMSPRPDTRRWASRPGTGLPVRWSAGDRWVAAAVAAILVAVVALAIEGQLTGSHVGQPPGPAATLASTAPPTAGGSVPDPLRHAWQRPLPVAPGPDLYGSGFLDLTGDQLQFGREAGAGASRSVVEVAGPDTLKLTATAETQGCQTGDVATYRWTVEGNGTVMTLTSLVADPCPAREVLVAGPWVRADLPTHPGGGSTLAPGTYTTSSFDPFADPVTPGRLSYTVPAGWEVIDDGPGALVLHSRPDVTPGLPSRDFFVSVIAGPTMAAEVTAGTDCSAVGDAPGVGRGRDELVAAIRARSDVVSTSPTEVTVGGLSGMMLDVRLSPSWTTRCMTPAGPIIGALILHVPGSPGSVVGVSTDGPLRLILVDLTGGRTMAVVIFGVTPSASSPFEAQAAAAMPIVEKLEVRRSTP